MAQLDWWPEYGDVDDLSLLDETSEAPLSAWDTLKDEVAVWQ